MEDWSTRRRVFAAHGAAAVTVSCVKRPIDMEPVRTQIVRQTVIATNEGQILNSIPLWALTLATITAGFLSVEAGYRFGRMRSPEPEKDSSVAGMVAATLGLLAFMLAFTFGLASSRFDARGQLILEEANAIRTCYLRASLLPEPQRSTIRDLLADYVNARLESAERGKMREAVANSRRLYAQLWTEATAVAEKQPTSTPVGLFLLSLNHVIDVHEKRALAGLRGSVPNVIWATLYFVAVLSMGGIGYHEGLTCLRRSPAAIALILTFSAVLSLIADLDRPREGLLRVSQQAMIELRNSLR
jgi:hypothetical protein